MYYYMIIDYVYDYFDMIICQIEESLDYYIIG